MMQAPFLKPGDLIGICAPARKVSRNDTSGGIQLLKSWGFDVIEAPHLYEEFNQFSGNDEARISDMQFLVDHPDVKAIISARGGYGCVRIIDHCDFKPLIKNPKWIIGFSDLTVFHSHLLGNYNLQSMHGPMLFNLGTEQRESSSAERLFKLLIGEKETVHVPVSELAVRHNRYGVAEGVLCGGNLSIIYSLSGTPSDINTAGKILFLEDLDEYLYHIDRMMMQLLRSGKLSALSGLIVGGMTDMKDNTVPFGETAEQIIRRITEPFDYPLMFGFPAGHIHANQPLIMGADVKMYVGDQCKLEYT